MQITAARLGSMLCESWRGVSNPNTFDPTQLENPPDLAIEKTTYYDGSAGLLGIYSIAAGGVDYRAVLSWTDVSTGLRELNVTVIWEQGGSVSSTNKSFNLTTYTLN